MNSIHCIGHGLRQALRHPGLVILAWLLALVPALLVVGTAAPIISGQLGESMFADDVVTGHWMPVWLTVVLKSHSMAMKVPARGAGLALPLVLGLQILLAAFIVERLLERRDPSWRPDWSCTWRTTWRFVRSAVWFGLSLVLVLVVAGVVLSLFTDAASEHRNGWLDLAGAGLAALLFIAAFIPLDLAHDFSRIAAARHDDGGTARGFVRALWAVLRQPRRFLVLYAGFAVLTGIAGGLALLVQLGWTATSAGALLVLVLLQQLVMVLRAWLKVAFWAAEIRCYGELGEPRWCRPGKRGSTAEEAPETVAAPAIKTLEAPAP